MDKLLINITTIFLVILTLSMGFMWMQRTSFIILLFISLVAVLSQIEIILMKGGKHEYK